MNEQTNDAAGNTSAGALVSDPLAKAPDASGAKVDPLELQPSATEHSPATGGTEAKSNTGFLSGLFQRAIGNKAACDCGKTPGTTGRHRKGCALEKGNGWFSPKSKTVVKSDGAATAGHFRAPVAPSGAQIENPAADVVSSQSSAAPVDHSVYGACAETFLRFRLKWKQWRKEKKLTPVLGQEEAKEMAESYDVREDDLQRLREKMTAVAVKRQWKALPPELEVAMLWGNIEFHWFVQDQRLTERLIQLQKALEEQSDLQRQGQQQAPQPKAPENGKIIPVVDWKSAIAPAVDSAPMPSK